MNKKCIYHDNNQCTIWADYKLTLLELEEADELCKGNWKEIQELRDHIEYLEKENYKLNMRLLKM